jgi:diguanylate cyclase (GGDEF)-like protein
MIRVRMALPNDSGSDPGSPHAQLRRALEAADPARATDSVAGAAAARRALAQAQAQADTIAAGQALAWLCVHLYRSGHLLELRQTVTPLLPLLDGDTHRAERRETLRLLSMAGSESGAYESALAAANRLVAESAESGEPGLALIAAFALAACFDRMGDSWQAIRVMTDALGEHGERAPTRERIVALNAVCALSLGNWHRIGDTDTAAVRAAILDRARSYGEQALALVAATEDPVYEVTIGGNLGEVLLHQGHLEPARVLLDRAHRKALERGLAAYGWRIECSRGAWLLAQERHEEALAAMTALLAEMAARDGPLPVATEIRARDVAYRACRALGWFEAALAHFEAVERLERQRTVAQLRALSEIFVTRSEAHQAQREAERRTDEARAEAVRQRLRAQRFAQSAEQDALTGLANRRHFERRIAELLEADASGAPHPPHPLALALLDVDHFKAINDRFGHPAGDTVLVALAQLLRENMRGGDVLARLGGEEFVIVLPDTPTDRAREVCERLRERVERHTWPGCPGLERVTASIGLAMAPPHDAAELMRRADQALYAAKGGGRNRLVVGG